MLRHIKLGLGMSIFIAAATTAVPLQALSHHKWKSFKKTVVQFGCWLDELFNTQSKKPYSVFMNDLYHVTEKLIALEHDVKTHSTLNVQFKTMVHSLVKELTTLHGVLANPVARLAPVMVAEIQCKCAGHKMLIGFIDAQLNSMVNIANQCKPELAGKIEKFRNKTLVSLAKKHATKTNVIFLIGLSHRLGCR